ncbi:lipopolysaccharide biosynthesis protein [Pseudozobellia thermophila]|uniref:Membrane protein involved in the export of O-antigen and teichoic acid n=1 Tax=Pseudozobellia thermophila TaxID=192903 RepID=A0A1M6BQQ1_9FLAO|nr:oligosaccharide flippase family protein [Pseudozobellia thermophila]SHI51016.1 Membrane protein involved in the export of O-antigen and teichoic acid [Pseudozobellia thermophila]
MNPLKKLFKQTAIYGLATVLPRMMSFLLLPLYTGVLETKGYGEISVIFAWFAIFNVLLAYGMETAFFRFYNGGDNKQKVVSTSLVSIMVSTAIFTILALLLQNSLARATGIGVEFIRYAIFIIAFDALVIIPFAWLRANEKPMRYAVVKILNVAVNLGLNIFFLLVLPKMVQEDPDTFFGWMYRPDFEISYIFISNLVASILTLLLMLKLYIRRDYTFDTELWKRMMRYGWPVLVAGIAFTINEVFDRILLENLLPADIAKSEVGKYSACYKLGLFMTLFATAFRMGIEPFFFSHAGSENPQRAYAQITNYFVVLGSIILLAVVVFADILKLLFVRNEAYWEAMDIVPLIILASFFLGIYHNLSVWYKVTDKTRYGAFISVIGAIITIGINYVFIPYIGYMASAIATLLAYGSMMALSYYLGRSRYPVPYNFRKITFYLGISILFSTLSFYVFNRNLIIGIVLLLLFLGLVYKLENDKLRQIFFKKGPKQG